MKTIGTFGVVVIASIALLQPAEGRQRGGGGGGRSFSSGHSFSGSARHFSSGPRNFSGGSSRSYRSAQRYSSQPSYRHRAYSSSNSSRRFNSAAALRNRSSNQRLVANRTADFNRSSNPRFAANRSADISRRPRSDSDARFAPSRRAGVRSQGFNNNGGRVVGNHTRNWNRNRDHNWRGNRCRWRNNHWVIIGPWFYPWGYGYYPYASYSYYDDRYYDDDYYADEYAQSESGDVDFNVSEVQSALARAGYYDGAIDGSLGPATRNALRRYQRDRGLSVTGRIDRSVVEALRLR